MSKVKLTLPSLPESVKDFLLLFLLRSVTILAWIASLFLIMFFFGILVTVVIMPSDGGHGPWYFTQLLGLLNLIWMVPVIVLAFWGSYALMEEAF